MTEAITGVKTGLWFAIAVVAMVIGFALGYGVSARTGVEPGYFQTAEAGGYGVAPKSATEGISEELRKHYEELTK